MIDNDSLWHRVYSELLFTRAVMSAMAAFLMLACTNGARDVAVYLFLYAAYNVVRSALEWMRE